MGHRSVVLNTPTRFEVVEHEGEFFGIRQTNPAITKAISKHEDPQSRMVEMVIQITCEALPVLNTDGSPQVEEVTTPVLVPEFDAKGQPVLEVTTDAKGRPHVVDGRPQWQAKMGPKLDADGKPVVEVKTRAKYTLGKPVFTAADFDGLMQLPGDADGFLSKVVVASNKVNDRESARDRAKKA